MGDRMSITNSCASTSIAGCGGKFRNDVNCVVITKQSNPVTILGFGSSPQWIVIFAEAGDRS
jgi:hypothetical protein